MKKYTGREYLQIAIANAYGLDKLLFEERIEWVEAHGSVLEYQATEAAEPLLYMKAVHSYREAEQGTPTGFMMPLDAVNSGCQIMSALTGCIPGATATGLIDPNKRADAYSDLTDEMNTLLGGSEQVTHKRADVKQAFMTYLYGSKAMPISLFGEDTPAYRAFFEAMENIAPGAVACRDALINAWRPYADEHVLDLPDGFHAVMRTKQKVHLEFNLQGIPGGKYNLIYSKFKGTKKGVAMAANTIHAIDAMVVREMNRRCNYNLKKVEQACAVLTAYCGVNQVTSHEKWVSLNMIDKLGTQRFNMNSLCQLRDLCNKVLQWKSSPLLCIHDAFLASPNHMNKVRYWYKEILAELADSNLLQDLLRQLYKNDELIVEKGYEDLGTLIRQSNYALT